MAAKATRALALEHPDRVELAEPSVPLSGLGPSGLGSSSERPVSDELMVVWGSFRACWFRLFGPCFP